MEASNPPGAGAHEFGPYENEVIGKAGRWIGYWSWIAIVSGIAMMVGGIFAEGDLLGGLIMGTVYLFIGIYFRGSASAMKEVVETAGNDVQHLMTALDKLGSAFKVMVLLVFIGVILALIAGLVGALGMGG